MGTGPEISAGQVGSVPQTAMLTLETRLAGDREPVTQRPTGRCLGGGPAVQPGWGVSGQPDTQARRPQEDRALLWLDESP